MVYIKNLDIKSFRGISSLQLSDLSPINILTGDNNCGKTSVLEIIQSYADPGDLRVWGSLLRRDTTQPLRLDSFSYYEGFYDLFDVNKDEKRVEYIVHNSREESENRDHVVLTAVQGEEEMSQEEYNDLAGIFRISDEEVLDDSILIVPKIDVQIILNDELAGQACIAEGQRRNIYKNNKVVRRKDERNIIYISPSRHAEGRVYLTDILKYPELYDEMLDILKEYDEGIISINYDNDSRYSGRGIYKILSRSCKEALPLNVYGDGMKKAILLMSAVLKAQNGILLLDEFETAIHTSAMDRTFRWILETCLKLNVQVFLTSHSKEAIDKVLKCSEKVRAHTALYTLYKTANKITARRLTGEKAVEVQDEMGLELR
ncbi:MAG TPA: AAA family ATPase [Candidatus Scybalocola faecigallinarum]|uniref:AAA family ATPase n=1 Tax=Candidatus Scybalocola faecigallinarum TaxID=2840941 RepID=A0A9D1JQ86_9FIRM|nr:AAA family ATPase [Candidatus Scybalocola faecigallinarum]